MSQPDLDQFTSRRSTVYADEGIIATSQPLAAFAFYYNFQRPNQALDNRTPVEEVTNS